MDRRSTELSKVIRNTLEQTVCLELLPRSQIDVYVQVSMCAHSMHTAASCACLEHEFCIGLLRKCAGEGEGDSLLV